MPRECIFKKWWWVIIPVVTAIFAWNSVLYQIAYIQAENNARLRWEKQKYVGEIAETLCRQKEICEPLIEFKNKLDKEFK